MNFRTRVDYLKKIFFLYRLAVEWLRNNMTTKNHNIHNFIPQKTSISPLYESHKIEHRDTLHGVP